MKASFDPRPRTLTHSLVSINASHLPETAEELIAWLQGQLEKVPAGAKTTVGAYGDYTGEVEFSIAYTKTETAPEVAQRRRKYLEGKGNVAKESKRLALERNEFYDAQRGTVEVEMSDALRLHMDLPLKGNPGKTEFEVLKGPAGGRIWNGAVGDGDK